MGAELEHMKFIALAQTAVGIGHRQRAEGGKHILSSCSQEYWRGVGIDLMDQLHLLRVRISDLLLAGEQLQGIVHAGHIGTCGHGITQDHGIGLVFRHHACGHGNVTACRETAGDDLVGINIPFLCHFPQITHSPGNLLHGSKTGTVSACGIPQDKGMDALCGIRKGDRLTLTGRAVNISATGTYDHRGTLLFLSQGDLTIQDVTFQGGIRITGDGHMNHFHGKSSISKKGCPIRQQPFLFLISRPDCAGIPASWLHRIRYSRRCGAFQKQPQWLHPSFPFRGSPGWDSNGHRSFPRHRSHRAHRPP